MSKRISLAFLLLAACGDNKGSSVEPDASAPDAPPDASGPFVAPTPVAVPLAAAGPDQLMAAAVGPNNTFYAAGFAAQTVAGMRDVTVVRVKATGELDTTFSGDGIASTGVNFVGASDEIDLVVLPDGKLLVSAVVAAAVANPLDAADRDIAIIKLNTDGTLDTAFGGGDGIATFSFNTSILNTATPPAAVGRDGVRSLLVAPDGKIYVHAYQRNIGATRTDTDFVVARILADGSALDTTWGQGGSGKFMHAEPAAFVDANATPRGIHLVGNQILATGYASSTLTGGTTQPVLYKLLADGSAVDTAFAGGLFHEEVLAIQTEVYNVAVHGTKFVTAGYGRNAGTTNDWVSLRFDLATGVRDESFGGVTAPVPGAVVFDPSGAMLGSNCRNAIAGPNGRTILIGSAGPGNMPAQDAVFAVLDGDGKLDSKFGSGIHKYKLGADGNDQFWAGVASGNRVLIVGYKGGGMTQTDTVNDDSYAVILPMD